jgi:hypothetical protein
LQPAYPAAIAASRGNAASGNGQWREF